MSKFKLNNDLLRKMVARVLQEQEGDGEELAFPDPNAGDSITALGDVLAQAGIKYVWLQSGEDFWLPDSKLNVTVHQSREPQGNPMRKKDLMEKGTGASEPSLNLTRDTLSKIIQEEVLKEISYQDIKGEYNAILSFLKQDILQKVGSVPLADTLEFLANDIRDGIHEPDPYDKENWAYFDRESGEQPNLKKENENPPEEKSKTGTGDQRDAAKEQGMKTDVINVAKFMFQHKQLGPALNKIKGDEIEAAQLMVLIAQELGIDASELQKMQVKMKAAMTKAED